MIAIEHFYLVIFDVKAAVILQLDLKKNLAY